MKYLLLPVLLFTFSHGLTQNWQPMPHDGAIYRYYYEHYAPPNFARWREQYLMSGDTTIGQYSYTKLYSTNYSDIITWKNYEGGIREDSTGKVFFYPKYDTLSYFYVHCKGNECLLFDFGLQVGDTVFLASSYGPLYDIVSVIETINITGQPRKRYIFQSISPPVIEGIGWISSLFYPLISWFETSVWMTCYTDSNIYYSPISLNFTGCLSVGIDNSRDASELKVYPNPVSEILYLQLCKQHSLRNGVLQVFDVRGMLIREIKLVDGTTEIMLPVTGLSNGLYLGRLTSISAVHTFRFVVE